MKSAKVVHPGVDGFLSVSDLTRVLDFIHAGEPVALPTETVYGLAADALRPEACARIFEVKERPFTDPLICHLPDAGGLSVYADADDLVRALAEKFWPGPLSLVLPKKPCIPDLVTAGSPKVALRCSAHPLFVQIVQAWNGPLAAPSANRFGRISPTTAAAVLEELGERISLIVDGGACSLGVESTIVEPVEGGLRLLRRGPIQPEDLAAFAPVINPPIDAVAPGRLPWHYAPRTPLQLLYPGDQSPKDAAHCGLLAWRGDAPGDWAQVTCLSPTQDLEEAARNLYASLRGLDACGLDMLYAEALPETGLGRTLMERLRKAAARG
jgi:L-threonylcarbamoyladenylate synthase